MSHLIFAVITLSWGSDYGIKRGGQSPGSSKRRGLGPRKLMGQGLGGSKIDLEEALGNKFRVSPDGVVLVGGQAPGVI
jgi:hypothetical protein